MAPAPPLRELLCYVKLSHFSWKGTVPLTCICTGKRTCCSVPQHLYALWLLELTVMMSTYICSSQTAPRKECVYGLVLMDCFYLHFPASLWPNWDSEQPCMPFPNSTSDHSARGKNKHVGEIWEQAIFEWHRESIDGAQTKVTLAETKQTGRASCSWDFLRKQGLWIVCYQVKVSKNKLLLRCPLL